MDIQDWQIRFWAARDTGTTFGRQAKAELIAAREWNEEIRERDEEHAAMIEYRKKRDRRILGRG